MGFYGNITNTNKTQFTFDRIYPNRKTMDSRITTDEIYMGRYVLIEYDMTNNNTLDTFVEVYKINNKFYTANEASDALRIKYTENEVGGGIFVKKGQVVKVKSSNNESYDFYECIGRIENTEYASFKILSNETNYTLNYGIDTATYGAGRGYDSTVWQKVYTETGEKYVMIAELNSVVPTFDLAADPPTMTPIMPHFDTNSTNVYYKLHWQPQWGLRVAAQEDFNSDSTTTHQSASYNKNTGELVTTTREDIPAAINFNRPAFESQVNSKDIIKKYDNSGNYITILPTGSSGLEYDAHDGSGQKQRANDIQEMRINLPAIGNMMSDAWDIIHGENRDNSPVDSLQGRLDFFTKEIKTDEIPVQHQGGYLVGATINGGKTSDEDNTGKNDDAWIETKVDATNKTITINHTFNEGEHNTKNENMNTNGDDTINLYVPEVDDMGHVIGDTITTVTLPFGYKIIKAQNTADTAVNAPSNTINANGIKANTTQDTLNINASNRWIKIDNNTEDTLKFGHKLSDFTQGGAANTKYGLSENLDISKLDSDNSFEIPYIAFDEAGHINFAETHTITLPENFSKISVTTNTNNTIVNKTSGTNGDIEADTLTDSLVIAEGNKWINIDAVPADDKIVINHYIKQFNETTDTTDFDEKNSFTVQDLSWDEAGHLTSSKKVTYTLQDGFKTLNITNTGSSTTKVDNSATNGNIIAVNQVDTAGINAGNRWITLDADVTNKKLNIYHAAAGTASETAGATTAQTPAHGATFNIPYIQYDQAGHIAAKGTTTVTIPSLSISNDTSGNVVTDIALNTTTGAFTETKENVGTLALVGYAQGSNVSKIVSTDTINSAFSKIQCQLDAIKGSGEIAENFDSIKEIADWLKANDSNADKIIDGIATLNGNDTVSGSVANSIKQAIGDLDSEVEATENKYISSIKIVDGKLNSITETEIPIRTITSGTGNGTISVNGTDISITGWNNLVSNVQADWNVTEGLAAILNKPDNLITTDTEFIYNEENIENNIEEEKITIAGLIEKIKELEEKIKVLENNNENSGEEETPIE